MTEPKTRPTDASVEDFLAAVPDERRREDCRTVAALMARITGEEPRMWGDSIVGFGSYHYRYASGREGDWPLTGFSPRTQSLTLYIMSGFTRHEDLLSRLGKHSIGSSCLYLKRLDQVDLEVLEDLVSASVADVRERHSHG